jgi:hypothetical protein
MISIAYLRSQVAQEIEETLKFGDLSDKFVFQRIRERVTETKPYYKLPFKHGEVRVYGPRMILINGVKYTSLYEARRKLISYIY